MRLDPEAAKHTDKRSYLPSARLNVRHTSEGILGKPRTIGKIRLFPTIRSIGTIHWKTRPLEIIRGSIIHWWSRGKLRGIISSRSRSRSPDPFWSIVDIIGETRLVRHMPRWSKITRTAGRKGQRRSSSTGSTRTEGRPRRRSRTVSRI